MKKSTAALLAAAMVIGAVSAAPVTASAEDDAAGEAVLSFKPEKALYAHAVTDSKEKDAWCAWQCEHTDELEEVNVNTKYFFMPSSVDGTSAELYNAGDQAVTIGSTEIKAGETALFDYELGKEYTVVFDGEDITVSFLRSTAEAAIYVNNSNADDNGTDLFTYLTKSKSNSAKATGAIVNADGTVDNTPIKKIKGRGNTTWQKTKKPFNITYDGKVSVAGMEKGKKYSLLANYQDDSLSRNRFLYDLSDAVGIPYASESRYVDFYIDGCYFGSYQIAQKIEVGSSEVVNDIDDEAYLAEDGKTVNEDFPFVVEIDPSASSDDYTVKASDGSTLTIKSPELSSGDPGYDEVKAYVKKKYNDFSNACANPDKKDLSEYADIDSVAKLYLINELGKNWDSGVASTFFTYKQDSDGKYKFFGSPVWDYDNSLGNANGIAGDLNKFGVKDYTEYTGWWCEYKGRRKGSKTSSNIMSNIAVNKYIKEVVPTIWFEEFVPAMQHFDGSAFNEDIDREFYTADKYYALINGSAEMNYKSGWLLYTGDWVADHSSLNKAHFDYKTGEYSAYPTKQIYPQTFEGMYNYAVAWFESRAAWLSSQFYDDYKKSLNTGLLGDANGDGAVNSEDALTILRASIELEKIPDELIPCADINGDSTIDTSDAVSVLRYSVGFDDGLNIGLTK